MSIKQRIRRLEVQRAAEPHSMGIRTFEESKDTVGIFYELAGTAFYAGPQPYSQDDIRALCSLGWTCIVVVYPGHKESGNP